MTPNHIRIYRGEVLSNDVQHYASSNVSGGHGTITTQDGIVSGNIAPITTTVNHHSDQKIWIRDLESGKDIPIPLIDQVLNVRAGHRLKAIFDESTQRFERILNESTGKYTSAQGKINSDDIPKIKKNYLIFFFYSLAMCIPVINFLFAFGLVGIVAHSIFSSDAKAFAGESFRYFWPSTLATLVLLPILTLSPVFFVNEGMGIVATFINLISGLLLFFAMSATSAEKISIIQRRSKELDDLI